MNFLDDSYAGKGQYCIIEDHDMEVLEGLDALDSVEIIDICAHGGEVLGTDVLCEVELIEPLEDCDKHYEKECELEAHEMREINRNSNEKEKPLRMGGVNVNVTVELREVEVSINTSTVEEVIYKKHRVEIVDKRSRVCIMEGVVVGYTLVGRVYDPDIVLEFEDGRRFYNENFGYLMLFYI